MSSDESEFSESESSGSEEVETVVGKEEKEIKNKPYDEALEISSSSISASEGKPSPIKKGGREIKNQPFDEALELSESFQSPAKEAAGATSGAPLAAGSEGVKNKPFDEQIELSDSDASVETTGQPSPKKVSETPKKQSPKKVLEAMPKTVPEKKPQAQPKGVQEKKTDAPKSVVTNTTPSKQKELEEGSSEGSGSEEEESGSSEGEGEEEEEEGEEEEESATEAAAESVRVPVEGAYNERDYAHLNVSQEIKELFQYIGRFKPQEIELDSKLKCFIPEYIPAVGSMDAFLKIPRVDDEPDNLGLKVLDEPSLKQSDATVLDLRLRAVSKQKHGDVVVRHIENAEKNPKDVDRWIKSIADLHRSKPPPQVHYSKTMPDIESLMQVWPEEFEELLSRVSLPGVELDIPLEDYARLLCVLLDIPIHKNVSESLHVLFTLFMEFRNNQHFMNFNQMGEGQGNDSSYARK